MPLARAQVRSMLNYMDTGMRRLAEIFGSQTTIGEVRAAVVCHNLMFQGKRVTVSELARESEQSVSSVSRWVHRGALVRLVKHPDDGRAKLVESDFDRFLTYLEWMVDSLKTAREQNGTGLFGDGQSFARGEEPHYPESQALRLVRECLSQGRGSGRSTPTDVEVIGALEYAKLELYRRMMPALAHSKAGSRREMLSTSE